MNQAWRAVLGTLLTAAACLGGAALSLVLTVPPREVLAVWWPSGIAVGILLRFGYQRWPGVFLATFLTAAASGGGIAPMAVLGAGAAGQALAASWALRRVLGAPVSLERVRSVFLFGLIACLASTILATLGWLTGRLLGWTPPRSHGADWLGWWLGEVAAILLVTPLFVASSSRRAPERGAAWWLELGGLTAALAVMCVLAAPTHHDLGGGTLFALPGLLTWAAFRFGQREVMAVVLATGALVVWSAGQGRWAAAGEQARPLVAQLHMYMGLLVVAGLTLSAAAAERREAEDHLVTARVALETRVGERLATLSGAKQNLEAEVAEARRAEAQLATRNRELAGLYSIVCSSAEFTHPEAMLGAAAEATMQALGWEAAAIHLLEPVAATLALKASRGWSESLEARLRRLEVGTGLCGAESCRCRDNRNGPTTGSGCRWVADFRPEGRRLFHRQIRAVEVPDCPCAAELEQLGHRKFVSVLLLARSEPVGSLSLASRQADQPVDQPLLLTVGQLLGTAAQNAMLYDRLQQELGERRQAQGQLAERARDLARSNADLEQFAYAASHDLQEPLRMVSSFTQLLARRYQGKLGEDADRYISFAVEGATRMQSMISDLLAYSRIGTRGGRFEAMESGEALGRALTALHMAVTESSAQITRDTLPVVVADQGQLTQLFQNLVGNAIRFRGAEPPRIHVSATHQKGGWCFSVRDNGIGIDPKHADRIFVIFQRLHTREAYPGTGIGLSVCRKIVERHGGKIWVESQPGQGADFRFTIPERSESAPPVGVAEPHAAEES